MSHFSVAVFTDKYTNVEDLLEPFDENIDYNCKIYTHKV